MCERSQVGAHNYIQRRKSHGRKCARCFALWLILGRIPAPPTVAFPAHVLDEFKKFTQIVRTLPHIRCPYLLASTVMGLIHEDNHRRVVGQRWMLNETAKNIPAKHAVGPSLNERPHTLYEVR